MNFFKMSQQLKPTRSGARVLVAAFMCMAAVSCSAAVQIPTDTTSTTGKFPAAPSQSLGATSGASGCHLQGSELYVLPDPRCTPGATNPDVNQENIRSTICKYGWTSTVRPSESYTEHLKRKGMDAYAETGSIRNYEEDHFIPLELGGSPSSPQNLWPEPGTSPNPKDKVEDAAKRKVCDGRLSLISAQQAIAKNWITFGQELGVLSPNS